MKLSEKFESKEQFLAYAEYTSGMDFKDDEVMAWFDKNPDFQLSYTGIMKVLNTMGVPKPKPVEETPSEEE